MKSVSESIKTQKELEDLLEGYGIETYKWGESGFQSTKNLFDEIKDQECELSIQNGKLIRIVKITVLYVYYKIDNIDGSPTLLKLRESMRIFRDENGKYINKNIVRRKYPGSIGTKIRANEMPLEAAKECVRRKLGTFVAKGLENGRDFIQERTSLSYPNLTSNYRTYEYDLYLDSTQYQSLGYCHEDEKSILILEWIVA